MAKSLLELAIDTGCSSYDAEFVVLAQHLGCRLLTFDRKLLKLFPDIAMQPASTSNSSLGYEPAYPPQNCSDIALQALAMQNHSVIKSFTNDRAGAQQIEGEMPALELHHQGLAMLDQCMKAAVAVSKGDAFYRAPPAR